jgi:tRNA-splicing endonuclease subunit Sen54
MADEDEDLSHLRGPEPAEIDLSEETQDYRFLDKLTYETHPSYQRDRGS